MPPTAAPDQQEMSEAIAHAVQRAVEAALAAVLQEQQRQKKKTTEPPLPLSEVERQIAKATNDATAPRDRHGFRGTPPPADFSLADLRDDSLLTEYEVASLTRLSTNTLAAWRKRKNPLLAWTTIGGGRCIRYRVAAVKQFLASGRRPRPGRPRKKSAAPAIAQDAAPSRKPRNRRPKVARRSSRRRTDDQPEAASVP